MLYEAKDWQLWLSAGVGDAVTGDAVTGDAVPGDAVPGDAVAGELVWPTTVDTGDSVRLALVVVSSLMSPQPGWGLHTQPSGRSFVCENH